MKKINFWAVALFSFFITIILSTGAFADDAATPTQLGLRAAASPQMERITDFHNLLLWIITPIVIFVTGLLAWVAIRYNKKSNPVASKTTHHVMLEILWTVVSGCYLDCLSQCHPLKCFTI